MCLAILYCINNFCSQMTLESQSIPFKLISKVYYVYAKKDCDHKGGYQRELSTQKKVQVVN